MADGRIALPVALGAAQCALLCGSLMGCWCVGNCDHALIALVAAEAAKVAALEIAAAIVVADRGAVIAKATAGASEPRIISTRPRSVVAQRGSTAMVCRRALQHRGHIKPVSLRAQCNALGLSSARSLFAQ